MKHETRKKSSIIGAVVGGVASLLATGNIIDIAINSAIWYGIVYGVCSLIIKYGNR